VFCTPETGTEVQEHLPAEPQEERTADEAQGGVMSTPILSGRCSMCGECCTKINLGRVAQFKEEQKEYLRAHGVIEDQGFFLIPFTCPHLKTHVDEFVYDGIYTPADDIQFTRKCNIHDKKPKICQKFDGKRYKNHTIFWVPRGCNMVIGQESPGKNTKRSP